jgi:hypothetical protein
MEREFDSNAWEGRMRCDVFKHRGKFLADRRAFMAASHVAPVLRSKFYDRSLLASLPRMAREVEQQGNILSLGLI